MKQGIQQGIQQGMQQGIQQGMQQGIQQGMQQGMQQGLEQGRAKAIKETARKLKSMGLALTDIQLATGLSEEDILDL